MHLIKIVLAKAILLLFHSDNKGLQLYHLYGNYNLHMLKLLKLLTHIDSAATPKSDQFRMVSTSSQE